MRVVACPLTAAVVNYRTMTDQLNQTKQTRNRRSVGDGNYEMTLEPYGLWRADAAD